MNTSNMLSNIECFHKTSTDFVTGINPPYHRHDNTYEIYVYLKGNTTIYIEQHCYKMKPGNLIVVHPSELHRSSIIDHSPYERIAINIDKSCLDALSSENSHLADCFENCLPYSKRIIQLQPRELQSFIRHVDNYLDNLGKNEFGSDLICTNEITYLLVMLNRLFLGASYIELENIMPKIVVDTMNYIDSHLTEEFSLATLSKSVGYSPNYISAKFKENTGLTLREYILDKKIEAAKKQLLLGRNVSEACSLSGFNDYANFIRSFKKLVGISPKKWLG